MIVIGANSEVARAFTEAMLQEEEINHVYLCSSNPSMLSPFKKHLEIKYSVEVSIVPLNLMEPEAINFSNLNYDIAFSAAGYLGNTEEGVIANEQDITRILAINYTGLVTVLNSIANDLKHKQKKGTIICLSSVAGERGRQSNFIYGSAKAGITAYLSGLRNLLYKEGIHVMTVKPGFMDTKMTKGLDLPKPLTIGPEKAAKLIVSGYKKSKNTIYISGIWRLIMFVIRNIPEFIFKKLSL
ncbi:MAG: 3-oxoacyl-ACP reductase [Flavobacteriaceae bacterium]|nr:3-oxoacyl-ACP reductase [Flavobacteriaceae bacterium]|tara:strand:- start:658 stop:1380 length:723 start_codon:yes stop_codon:yes gene_type:complete